MTGRRRTPARSYPSTYLPVTRGRGVEQEDCFDPALKQYPNAFRAGEPAFDNPEDGRRWRMNRRHALDHVLGAIAGSSLGGQVVLRGSILLRTWFGTAARDPGDIDLVVTPADLSMDDAQVPMVDTLSAGVLNRPCSLPDLQFDRSGIAVDTIWTYERAPGLRVAFTWRSDGTPPGVVQVDLVFNEQLSQPPISATILVADGTAISLRAASPELSLAWKLLWLETDSYPQGKDLYDAVLLAEHCYLPLDLLRGVLARELGARSEEFTASRVLDWKVDWPNLRLDHPEIGPQARRWQERLHQALLPTFPGAR